MLTFVSFLLQNGQAYLGSGQDPVRYGLNNEPRYGQVGENGYGPGINDGYGAPPLPTRRAPGYYDPNDPRTGGSQDGVSRYRVGARGARYRGVRMEWLEW